MVSDQERAGDTGVSAIRLVPRDAAPAQPALEALGLVSLTSDLELPRREWLVEGLWPTKGVGFIGGPPKAGKSWLALDMEIALCTGQRFLGREVRSIGPVLHFAGEEFIADLAGRVDRLLAGRGLTRADLRGRLYVSELPLALGAEKAHDEIKAAVEEARPVLVVFDPLARYLGVADENSAKEMRPVNNFLRQCLSREGETAVSIIHHTGKDGQTLRGSGDLRAVSEVTLLLGEPKSGRVLVRAEMRGARPPKPFRIELVESEGGSMAWRVTGEAAESEIAKVQKARVLLRDAGADGVTQGVAQKQLAVRAERVPGLLESAGGVRPKPRGPWYAAQFAPPGEQVLAAA